MSIPESPGVEVAPLRAILRLYCQALTERHVEVQDLQQLVDKNIGWSKNDAATSDGAAIFLPAVVERFEAQSDNFDFLKVALTQQAGHIEFGSFDFDFTRPSTLFVDLRAKLTAPPEYHDHDHGHEGHHETLTATELTRFFRLFPNKRLALDIFSILESGRVESRVMSEYRGIAPLYRAMRERVLASRPEITLLPVREALLEYLVRLSLGGGGGVKIPRRIKLSAEIIQLAGLVFQDHATVEDAAEATLRIYDRLARVRNDYLEESEFVVFRSETKDSKSSSRRRNSSGSRASIAANGWIDDGLVDGKFTLSALVGRDKEYRSPAGVDYRGEFRPELAQLLTQSRGHAREQRKSLTPEELAELLRGQKELMRKDSEDEGEEQGPRTERMVQNLVRELERRDRRMHNVPRRPLQHDDDEGGSLSVTQPHTFLYDEWDVFANGFRERWCRLYEKTMPAGDIHFFRDTLLNRGSLRKQIRREFEQVMPEIYRKEKRLPDGVDHDLDTAVEAMSDLRIGISPCEKVFWRYHKTDRDVAVAFLLDMSGSTGEAIGTNTGTELGSDERTLNPVRRRIIDVEREAIVLMIDALESIGDRYGVYGFSGHGRDNVEFYIIKDIAEDFNLEIAKRIGRINPLHATRMGPAIRHVAAKMKREQTRSKFLFLISDGRPQDRGYSQEDSEKAYAVQDTRMALIEARHQGLHPFCLTVDKEGNDYLRTMMDDFSYEVLADVTLLPQRLPHLYKRLTF